MTYIRAKLTIDAIKIISLWICSISLFFKMGAIYQDFKTKLETYDIAVRDVKELKEWRQKVTAYYLPKKQNP